MTDAELSHEAVSMSAYLSHLDHCEYGCRPIRENRGSAVGFVPDSGQGCPVGRGLARAWERSQVPNRGMGSLQAGLYKHYKGGFYQALGIAEHTETDERLVIYVSLDLRPGPRLRARPASSWDDPVKWSDGLTRPRFSYQGVGVNAEEKT